MVIMINPAATAATDKDRANAIKRKTACHMENLHKILYYFSGILTTLELRFSQML